MVRRFISSEIAKLKEMTFAEKRWYIWEYYKLHIILGVVTLVIIGSSINTRFINPPKNDYLYIAWQADFVPMGVLENLGQELSVIVDNPSRYRVSVRSYLLGDDPSMNMALITRFHAMVSIGDLHALINTREETYHFAEHGMIRPLHEVVSAALEADPAIYAALSERLVTMTFTLFDEDVEMQPITDIMSIHIGGLPLLTELGIISEDLYLSVVINADRPESFGKLLGVLLGTT